MARSPFPPIFWSLSVLLATMVAAAREPLSFHERVRAQEALEGVYYAHRIWPQGNTQPKPPFEQVVPREAIKAKVAETLKECAALEKIWNRPITGEQLQAEIDRMVWGTKDPGTLKELFAALDNDPTLIAECLARSVLADRLIHSWYAYDARFHGEARERAHRAEREMRAGNLGPCPAGVISWVRYELQSEYAPAREEVENPGEGPRVVRLDETRWRNELALAPEAGQTTPVRESEGAFSITRTLARGAGTLELETRVFPKRPFDDWWEGESNCLSAGGSGLEGRTYEIPERRVLEAACTSDWLDSSLGQIPDGRRHHTAVWTGTEMIVWGGFGSSGTELNTGGRYVPSTDSWTATSTGANCPTAREKHTAVWTGTEMIIWGGSYLNTGGRYSPSADLWTATSIGAACPSGRESHTAVWAGTEMIVWGGTGSGTFNSGGRYSPSTDSWVATAVGTNCPAARYDHTAIWAGTEMIVWGGTCGTFCYFDTGGRYSPATNSWTATSTGANCPDGRTNHTAVWTGSQMVVWGGMYLDAEKEYPDAGGRYSPSTDSWQATSTGGNCPAGREGHTALWSGSEMLVWGGFDTATFFSAGGRYTPSTDSWLATPTGTGCPTGRENHTAVWANAEMIVWGGFDGSYLNTGGRYAPASGDWVPTSTGANTPAGRANHTAIWTGAEMVVWGGIGTDGADETYLNTGGRYSPATDSWAVTATGGNCPSERSGHTAIWTGTEMVVWGGANHLDAVWHHLDSGGRYSPSTNSWSTTSAGSNCPAGRENHTAIWTGSEMIIWGGRDNSLPAYFNTGGRYTPSTDSWASTALGANCPSGRHKHSAVWTGSVMIVWGGVWYDTTTHYENTGGRFSPSTGSWLATSTGTGCPTKRENRAAVWTGTEMVVWGGYNGIAALGTGGRYAPSSDSWAATSTGADCPSARSDNAAVWTGTEVIIWGGSSSNTGGRYFPTADSWAATSTGPHCPIGRFSPAAVWTDSEMALWGGLGSGSGGLYSPSPVVLGPTDGCLGSGVLLTTGSSTAYQWLKDGTEIPGATSQTCTVTETGSYSVRVPRRDGCTAESPPHTVTFLVPSITGGSEACEGSTVVLSTGSYVAYQWIMDGSDIPGATGQSYPATSSGNYAVRVTDSTGCLGTSAGKAVTIHPTPAPAVSGAASGCSSPGIALSTGPYSAYQWYRGGSAIARATGNSYTATLSGSYSVRVTDAFGCQGTSAPFSASLTFCATSEVSPPAAIYQARFVKTGASPTGFYLYFQKIDGATGYNLYEGVFLTWYSHANQPGNVCGLTVTDLGTGEMRAAITPSAGDHYYLVTAFDATDEGPSGYDSDGVEIPPSQNTCSP